MKEGLTSTKAFMVLMNCKLKILPKGLMPFYTWPILYQIRFFCKHFLDTWIWRMSPHKRFDKHWANQSGKGSHCTLGLTGQSGKSSYCTWGPTGKYGKRSNCTNEHYVLWLFAFLVHCGICNFDKIHLGMFEQGKMCLFFFWAVNKYVEFF